MKLEDIVLVRAYKNTIPLDGSIKPSSMGKYLTKLSVCDFKYIIMNIFKEEQLKKGITYNLFNDEDHEKFNREIDEYIPYEGGYTSTLSFSFNGLVPDDMNNQFSSYNVAVLDPLIYHLDDDFVNIHAIDTTIKGEVKISKKGIIVIEKSSFDHLSCEEQEKLNMFYKVELFSGDLKEAVKNILEKYGYPSLDLTQYRSDNFIEDCDIKSDVLKLKDELSVRLGVSTLRLSDLYFHDASAFSGADKTSKLKINDELKNMNIVKDYYKKKLYNFLEQQALELGILLTEDEKYYLYSRYKESRKVLEKLIKDIMSKIGGLENFKAIIKRYNEEILSDYLSAEEIVKLSGDSIVI